jgi:hypothetical protein
MSKMKKPEKAKGKREKVKTSDRKHSGKGSAQARLQQDMALVRQTTDRANP